MFELLNLFSNNNGKGWANLLVTFFVNVPLEIIFLTWFLLWHLGKKWAIACVVFIVIYLLCFLAEHNQWLLPATNFDSVSYGVGSLFLIAAIIIALLHLFKQTQPGSYFQSSITWIILGMILFYIGGFPYNNFRNYFWSMPGYENLAYTLHYMSQALCAIMYLMFAYAAKWKTK